MSLAELKNNVMALPENERHDFVVWVNRMEQNHGDIPDEALAEMAAEIWDQDDRHASFTLNGRIHELTFAPPYGTWSTMSISLTLELEAYVQQQADAAGFSSPEEFVRETFRRMMAEEQRHESAVVDGLRSPHARLTRDELDDIRKLATRVGGARQN